MPEADGIEVVAGECTIEFEGRGRERTQRGNVVVVIKPDDTVLVHDTEGYQPVAWLTRPEALTVQGTPTRITAVDGDQRLGVVVESERHHEHHPASEAGVPVGRCPDCDGALVRTGGDVVCIRCGDTHGLPRDATVLTDGEECAECGLPRVRVERGAAFEVCLDKGCDPLDERVRERFDREWDCPECDGDLRVLRRGGLIAGCERYPDCDVGFAFPTGIVGERCDCGLPAFETPAGNRCLDAACGEFEGTP